MSLIVACGLRREAALVTQAGHGGIVLAGGGDRLRLARQLDEAAGAFPGIILSTGLAGALDPALQVGDVVVDGDVRLLAWLRAALPGARAGRITGSDAIVATAAAKRALAAETGAVAVDMESHVAAAVARRHGLPFAIVRIISDRADETLPPAALVGMRADGGVALGAVLGSLAARPGQLPALIRTGRHASRAFRALGRCHHALARAGIGRLDLRDFPLDMR